MKTANPVTLFVMFKKLLVKMMMEKIWTGKVRIASKRAIRKRKVKAVKRKAMVSTKKMKAVQRNLKHHERRRILHSLNQRRIQKFKLQMGKIQKKLSFLLNQKKRQLTSMHCFLTKMGFWLMLYNSTKRMLMLFQSVRK